MEIPLGLRFQPFDYDVVRFLFEFATGRNNEEGLILEEDIFGDKEPWELIGSEKMAYFFSRLKKKGKSKTGCRVERTVGKKVKGKRSGNWHGQDKGKPVFDEKGRFVMGYKRCFIYKNRNKPEQDRKWLLKEFSLPETIMKKARAEYPIVEERKDLVLCRLERKKEDKDKDKDDEKTTTLEKGGNDLEVETTSSTLQIVPPSLSPSPSSMAGDDINSYFVGVPVDEATLALTDDDMNSILASHDYNNMSSYLNTLLPVGDADHINSIAEGVPIPVPAPVGDTDLITSYLVGVPMETFAPADRDEDHHITLPEPSSSSFMDLICNMEDVTRFIDFDFDV